MLRVATVPGQRCDAAGRVTRNDFCAQWPHGDQARWQADARGRDGGGLGPHHGSGRQIRGRPPPPTAHRGTADGEPLPGPVPAPRPGPGPDRPRFVADMVLLGEDLSVRRVWIAGVSGYRIALGGHNACVPRSSPLRCSGPSYNDIRMNRLVDPVPSCERFEMPWCGSRL